MSRRASQFTSGQSPASSHEEISPVRASTLPIFGKRRFVHGDAQSRSSRQLEESILDGLNRLACQMCAHATVLFGRRVGQLLNEKIGDAGGKLQSSGRRDWAAIVKRGHPNIVRLGDGCNPAGLTDAMLRKIGTDNVDGIAAQQVLEDAGFGGEPPEANGGDVLAGDPGCRVQVR